MDYENERWLKVYVRDTGGWASLSWQARGLALEIARKLDAAGQLPLGKRGLPALAGIIRGRWEDMRPFVEELMADERFVMLDGNILLDPEHANRQSARTAPALRKKAQRDREALSRDVTRSHAASQNVTIRGEERREEEIREDHPPLASLAPPLGADRAAEVGGSKPSKPRVRGTRLPADWTPSEATQAWAREQGVSDPCGKLLDEFRDFWAGVPGSRGVKLDWDATYRNRVRQVGDRPTGRFAVRGSEITKQPTDPDAPWMKLPEVG